MRLVATLCCAAFFASSAHAAELKFGKDWRNCSKDDQCVMIDGLCGKTSVNWHVQDKAEAFYKQEAKNAKCGAQGFWVVKEKIARCHLGGCDTRPKQASDEKPATQ